MGGFFPAFLERSHGLSLSEVGLAIALTAGAGGGCATYAFGHLADRLGRRDLRWNVYLPAIAAVLPLPFAPFCFLSDSSIVAIACGAPALALTAAFIGPVIATLQQLVPLRMRAVAVAVLILIDNLAGLGLGPQFVGVLSDALRPALGADSLRIAMLAAMLGSAVSAAAFVISARHLKAELAGNS